MSESEQTNSTVARLAAYPHVEVTVLEQDPVRPEGPVTGSLNRYSYSFPRGQKVVLAEPLLSDMEDLVARGRRRLIISRGRTYSAEEARAIREEGGVMVYPDGAALREALATVSEVRTVAASTSRRSRRTRDLAEREFA